MINAGSKMILIDFQYYLNKQTTSPDRMQIKYHRIRLLVKHPRIFRSRIILDICNTIDKLMVKQCGKKPAVIKVTKTNSLLTESVKRISHFLCFHK